MSIRKLLLLIAPFAIAISIAGCSGRFFEEPARPVRSMVNTPLPAPPVQREALPPIQPLPSPPPRPAQKSQPIPKPHTRQRKQPPAITSNVNAPQVTNSKNELASYETTFDTKEKNRNINIARAAETINNQIVKPGDTFSFNDTVGPTIKRRGYEKAMVYKNGEKSEGEGGGVCQVSSTLHMAAKNAGMTIVERHDHSLPVTYAKSGEEAAVSYGVQDFKFKNEKNHSVQIKSYAKDGKMKVTIHTAP